MFSAYTRPFTPIFVLKSQTHKIVKSRRRRRIITLVSRTNSSQPRLSNTLVSIRVWDLLIIIVHLIMVPRHGSLTSLVSPMSISPVMISVHLVPTWSIAWGGGAIGGVWLRTTSTTTRREHTTWSTTTYTTTYTTGWTFSLQTLCPVFHQLVSVLVVENGKPRPE